jgi:phytanoyl-CoA hydroxylase
MIRRLKLSYSIYNFFHRSKLKHNIASYKKYNIKKSYFSSVSSKDFSELKVSEPTLFEIETALNNTTAFHSLSQESKESLLNFETEGYAILRGFVDISEVNEINKVIEEKLNSNTLRFKYKNKIMFAFKKIPILKALALKPTLIDLLNGLMSEKVHLFQSINFIKGSEQGTHSDSIHMTTFPLGGLIGVWIALEDIDLENGPLHFYPKSHKLPYYMNKEYNNEGNFFLLGKNDYKDYEEMISSKIQKTKLEKKIFTAKAGDVLIWHANFFHGGEKQLDPTRTRKSVVFHYYAENRVCYHEITQRPTLM